MLVVDDLGIGDIGCYGNDTIKTPYIDKLSEEGIQLEHHLSAAALCTPSRAALLTARYPARYGLVGDIDTPPVPVHIASRVGLPESEKTIAEALSAQGYSTALVGKWHLGSSCQWFGRNCLGPLKHGFDYFYGLPLTLFEELKGEDSFWIFDLNHRFYQVLLITIIVTTTSLTWFTSGKSRCSTFSVCLLSVFIHGIVWFCFTHYRLHTQRWWQVSNWMNKYCNGIVMRNEEIIHQTIPFESLFQELVNESVGFIHSSANQERPFFLFHSFSHVHTPMFSMKKFDGRSAHGRYGDNVEEMDFGVGQILKALQDKGIEEDTIIYFASDHGGHLEAIDPVDGQRVGGYNKKFKGGKGMGAAEGGIRVPGIFRWKGTLTPGVHLHAPTYLLDMLPTFLDLASLPEIHEIFNDKMEIDGVSIAPVLRDPLNGHIHRRIMIHHCGKNIHALRMVKDDKVYKLLLYSHKWKEGSTQCGFGINALCSCYNDIVNRTEHPLLYELTSDPYEDRPIRESSIEYKETVREFLQFLNEWKAQVEYPPSQMSWVLDTILSPWLQPIKMD